LVKVKLGISDVLRLGNLNSKRDWGYAKEYVEVMWMMLQQKNPDDFVVATGKTHTVREFIQEAAKNLDMKIEWEGVGKDEKGIDKKTGKTVVEIDPRYFRPHDVNYLMGDITKSRKILEWEPKVSFEELVKLMVDYDLRRYKNNRHEIEID